VNERCCCGACYDHHHRRGDTTPFTLAPTCNFYFPMTPRLYDSSVTLVDSLDHSELTLVKESIFCKFYDLTTFEKYFEGQERLQSVIEDIAVYAIGHKVMNEDCVFQTDQAKYICENTAPGRQTQPLVVNQCSHLHHKSFALRRPMEDYLKDMLFNLTTVPLRHRGREQRSMVDLWQSFCT